MSDKPVPMTEQIAFIRESAKLMADEFGKIEPRELEVLLAVLRTLEAREAERNDYIVELHARLGRAEREVARLLDEREWRPIEEMPIEGRHGNYLRVTVEEGALWAPAPDRPATHYLIFPPAPEGT